MPVAPIPPLPPTLPSLSASGGATPSSGNGGTGFGQVLAQALSGLNALQVGADSAAGRLAAGNSSDLASAVIAAEKANLGLQLAVEVRNRAVSAYQQIMQMQV